MWNTSVRNSMLSRGGASAGVVGSMKAVCGPKRVRPSVAEVVALQEQRFVRRHLRNIEPAVVRIIFHRIGFAAAVRIDQVGSDEIAWLDRRAVQHRKRRVLQRAADRPPQIDDLHAAFQEFVGLIGQVLANAIAAGYVRLVDMDARRRLARTGAADIGGAIHPLADSVIEDEDAIRLQRRLEEGFDGGIIDASHFLIVVKVLDHGWMPDQGKALAVQ